jgi:hypothetical protein
MDFVASVVEQLRRQQQTDQTRVIMAGLIDTVQKTMSDPVPGVATWGAFLTAVHNPQKRTDMIDKLVADPDPTRRVLGLLIANSYPLDKQKQMLTKLLETEKEEMVRAYASGMLEVAKVAASQPTTAPATPTPGPVAAPVDPARNNLPGSEPAKP